ncbi:MAG: bifunctional phosphopantothenoylcysteine decarboxylase/phosphopantothenate--cysteine ligase CoaBC [Ignavibacteriales bacterium]|nr:bifunctional phosphopantothenoylcysteine decarboxylase/phosphopantothenate--cysteine ligase CoaBC [Ignavibacteriales bacterium]
MLRNKKILLGVTGGIAAYKIPQLIRDFKKSGADVKVVMTEAAAEFVTPLTISTLSQNEVVVGGFPKFSGTVLKAETWHINLALWADVMLIAPATANTIAKLVHGYADNAVTTLALAMRGPIIISPSMDVDMLNHRLTQSNISFLEQLGYKILQPEKGELASGLTGAGRLPDLRKILFAVEELLQSGKKDLTGRKILVTAGPTYEPIDPVRFIGNRSSGKMGFAIATAAAQRGANVILITGKTNLVTPKNVQRINIVTAEEMFNAVTKHAGNSKVIIMAAAVADYTPAKVSKQKIKKSDNTKEHLNIQLKPTIDILKKIGEKKGNKILVGFAVETENEIRNAKIKVQQKNLDFIVLNNPLKEDAGFDVDTNIATIVTKSNKIVKLKKMSKFQLANQILDRIAGSFNSFKK